MEIVQYHLRRNLVAYGSHRKTRLKMAEELNIDVFLYYTKTQNIVKIKKTVIS